MGGHAGVDGKFRRGLDGERARGMGEMEEERLGPVGHQVRSDFAAHDASPRPPAFDACARVGRQMAGSRLEKILPPEWALACNLVDIESTGVETLMKLEGKVKARMPDDFFLRLDLWNPALVEAPVEIPSARVQPAVVHEPPGVEAGENQGAEFPDHARILFRPIEEPLRGGRLIPMDAGGDVDGRAFAAGQFRFQAADWVGSGLKKPGVKKSSRQTIIELRILNGKYS